MITFLPVDSKARKDLPVATGVVDYFPRALVAIAELSRIGNDKHNPGEALHWARGKGGNNADELMRHFIERGTADADDGVLHSTKVAWRALAILELELEAVAAKAKEKPLIDQYKKWATAKPAPEKPSRAEVMQAFNASNPNPCGFARHNNGDPGSVYMCRCGANVAPGEARPADCDAPKQPLPGPKCGFDHGKHYPGVNYACAKCHCTVGDELRPSGCKHWITEALPTLRPRGMPPCPACGAEGGTPHKSSCYVLR